MNKLIIVIIVIINITIIYHLIIYYLVINYIDYLLKPLSLVLIKLLIHLLKTKTASRTSMLSMGIAANSVAWIV